MNQHIRASQQINKKTLIFDFFGVFCPDIALEWFKRAVPDYAHKLVSFQAICTQSDYGKLSRDAFNEGVSHLTGFSIDEIVEGIEAETAINTSLVAYVRSLRATGYRIACLSNGTHEWTLRVIKDHGLGAWFDLVVLSGDVGMIKPDARIYRYTMDRLGISAAQAVFIDDRQVNVKAAEDCGIQSLVFVNTPELINGLERLGVRVQK
jgi:epoxide hydrolase-like predicted phosphatase